MPSTDAHAAAARKSRRVKKIRALGGKNLATDLPPSGGHYLLVLLTAVRDHTMFASMDGMSCKRL